MRFMRKVLVKRTRKSMQVNGASFHNQIVRKDLPKMAKRIRKSAGKAVTSRIYSWFAINLCRLALGGQTVKNLRRLRVNGPFAGPGHVTYPPLKLRPGTLWVLEMKRAGKDK